MHLKTEPPAHSLELLSHRSTDCLSARAVRRSASNSTYSTTTYPSSTNPTPRSPAPRNRIRASGNEGRRPGRSDRRRGPKKPTSEIRATVLVADDEEMVLSVMRRLLERQGIRVLTATDGEDALQVFEQNRDEIDAVILDIVMPKLDGIATLQELRSMDPAVKILLASGYPERKVPDGEQPVSFLAKPCRPGDLALKLDDLLKTKPS